MRFHLIELLSLYQNLNPGWIQFRNNEPPAGFQDFSTTLRYGAKSTNQSNTDGKWLIEISFADHESDSLFNCFVKLADQHALPMEITITTKKYMDEKKEAGKLKLRFDRQFEESQEGYTQVEDFIIQLMREYHMCCNRELSITTIEMDEFDQVAFVGRRMKSIQDAIQYLAETTPEWKKRTRQFDELCSALRKFSDAVNHDPRLYIPSDDRFNHSPTKRMIDLIVYLTSKLFDDQYSKEEKIKIFKICQNKVRELSETVPESLMKIVKWILATAAAYVGYTYMMPAYAPMAMGLTLFTSLVAGHRIDAPNSLGQTGINVAKSAIEFANLGNVDSLTQARVQHV